MGYMGISLLKIHKAIFYLQKGDYTLSTHYKGPDTMIKVQKEGPG